MRRNRFPSGWDAAKVQKVLEHYDGQTGDEAVAEDEAAFRRRDQTVMVVPKPLVPAITQLIERRGPGRQAGSRQTKKTLQQTAHKPRRG